MQTSALEAAGLMRIAAAMAEREADSWSWPVLYSEEVGDLDGDGTEDLVEYEYTQESTSGDWWLAASVSGVSGATGSTLWRLEGGFVLAMPAGDLDGDGQRDVVALDVEVAAPSATGDTSWTTKYHGIDGSDGSVEWTRSFTFTRTVRYTPGVVVWLDRDYTLFLGDGGDVDGDGARDLLVHRQDITFVQIALTYRWESHDRFEIVSGRTGGTISTVSRPSTSPSDYFYGGAIGDVTADGRPDVGVVHATWSSAGTRNVLQAADGTTGSTAWTRALPDTGDLWTAKLLGAQLDGDPIGDVVVALEAIAMDTIVVGVAGNRDDTWSSFVDGLGAVWPTPDIDGDGGGDLGMRAFRYDTDENMFSVSEFGAVSGTTGESLWWHLEERGSSRDYNDMWETVEDATGDGVPDVLVTRFDCHSEEDPDSDGCAWVHRGQARLRSGSDGSIAWERTSRGALVPTGDIDGDGAADIVDASWGDDGDLETRYRAVSGLSGRDLWSDDVTTAGSLWWVNTISLKDPTRRAIIESNETDDGFATIARDGVSGQALWSRGA